MDGQMTIYDFVPKPKKEVSAEKCTGCEYMVWLHRGGAGIRGCDRAEGCRYTFNWVKFRDLYCRHQMAYIKFGDDEYASAACNFKDGKAAQCWDDWQKCTEDNCPFRKQGSNHE